MNEIKIKVTEVSLPDLDRQLKELAVADWEKFKSLTAIDTIQVYVCIERTKGRSLQQIANKLKAVGHDMSKQAVSQRCKKCQVDD